MITRAVIVAALDAAVLIALLIGWAESRKSCRMGAGSDLEKEADNA